MISVTVDIKGALRYLERIERDVVPRAAAAAINRTANSTAVEVSRQIARETGIPVREVRQRIKVRRASKDNLTAYVTAYPYSPNVKRFNARQTDPGVVASPWRRRRLFPGTFTMPSGAVVKRTGKARFPIRGIRGPSVRKEFLRGYALRAMKAKVDERFPIEFERAARQFMRT